ncbi:MAG: chorismate synthase [Psittacicella sp.]
MSGNSIGTLFKVTTFGESHGVSLGAIVDGIPPGFKLSSEDIQKELDKRKPGMNKFMSKRRETDIIEICSGLYNGVTTGTPIGLIVQNVDVRSQDYSNIMDILRPGHGDYTYFYKYGVRDPRGGGRASARETVMRVAAGAIAKKYLKDILNIEIYSLVTQIGEVKASNIDYLNIYPEDIYLNDFNTYGEENIALFDKYLSSIIKDKDSVGAKLKLIVKNLPIGLGEPVFDRLEADLAHALMGINASKGVEIGDGFNSVSMLGSNSRDEIAKEGFKTNHCGGVLAGVSTGSPIDMNIAFKATSSIPKPINTLDINGNLSVSLTKGRHDPCVGIRAVPVVEAMASIVIMDHFLKFKAQCR